MEQAVSVSERKTQQARVSEEMYTERVDHDVGHSLCMLDRKASVDGRDSVSAGYRWLIDGCASRFE